MPEATWKETALADFRTWLNQLEAEGDGAPPAATAVTPELLSTTDLRDLYAELAALRQEIRLQTRQQARALHQAETERAGRLEEARRGAVHGCLGPMLEVRDALVRGQAAAAAVAARRRWPRPRGVAAVAEGYAMAIERFDRVLHAAGVRHVATVGQAFDPHTMVAVRARRDGGATAATVVEELRAGFLTVDGALLRAAEVVVIRPDPATGGDAP